MKRQLAQTSCWLSLKAKQFKCFYILCVYVYRYIYEYMYVCVIVRTYMELACFDSGNCKLWVLLVQRLFGGRAYKRLKRVWPKEALQQLILVSAYVCALGVYKRVNI